ncbi:iron-sulfur cluster assembly accessory protein [Hyphomicrobiales bacterium]|jgi:iron-sulfur cluster assembly protein|nr:iron-sulfur cluster assembly accessory protein [Hyphomicrobiales bacterium]MDA9904957.1 iron-sulfur cluster assembly accessory protein [Hyphomicrobiales bacterium]MDB9925839.1 iron-sulfur cluster assembly accessory protein [Hyphomicrobiales bacterium]|tara:strand:- start:2981 stop:3379 length:399 start_codon:yes stop_codon:yes gene_type:complete
MKNITKNNLLSLTPSAIERLRDINKSSSNDNVAVKLGVKNGGCAGMAYTMDYINEVSQNDEVIKIDDITLVIDPKAILFLLGTEMDYEESTLNSGFIFNNPNQTDACGCGESVTLVEAEIPVDLADRLSTSR